MKNWVGVERLASFYVLIISISCEENMNFYNINDELH